MPGVSVQFAVDPSQGVLGTFMGRDALRLAAGLLALSQRDLVLLPAYLCREVLRPFQERCRIQFYDIGRDFSVDPEEIRCHLRKEVPRAVLFINYLGFPQPHRVELKRATTEAGCVLIEDCAHSLLTDGSGDTGDILIYSYRKLLPLPDGGGVRMAGNRPYETPRFKPRIQADVLSVLGWLKARLASGNVLLSRSAIAARMGGAHVESDSPQVRPLEPVLPISSFARRGLIKSDPAEITRRRRDDYFTWERWARARGDVQPVVPSLPAGTCPLAFPMVSNERDDLLKRLESAGLPAKVYWRLPPVIGAEFETSHWLSRHMVAAPVHPDLTSAGRAALDANRL